MFTVENLRRFTHINKLKSPPGLCYFDYQQFMVSDFNLPAQPYLFMCLGFLGRPLVTAENAATRFGPPRFRYAAFHACLLAAAHTLLALPYLHGLCGAFIHSFPRFHARFVNKDIHDHKTSRKSKRIWRFHALDFLDFTNVFSMFNLFELCTKHW